MQQCLCAASRTTFGGDVFFIVRDLFGGDGVVVAPLSVKRARGPVLSALDQHEDKGVRESGGDSPVEIEVRGGAGAGSNDGGGGDVGGVVSIVVTSRTAYGLYADEMVSGGSGSGGRNASSSSPSVVQQQEQQRRPRRRSLTHPMITLHATLVETIPVLITTPNNASDEPSQPPPQPELRVLARGLGAGRVLKLRAERPPSPCPSPPPIFAVYPEDAAAAGGGGPMCPPPSSPPRSLSPPAPAPARENDEISV